MLPPHIVFYLELADHWQSTSGINQYRESKSIIFWLLI